MPCSECKEPFGWFGKKYIIRTCNPSMWFCYGSGYAPISRYSDDLCYDCLRGITGEKNPEVKLESIVIGNNYGCFSSDKKTKTCYVHTITYRNGKKV